MAPRSTYTKEFKTMVAERAIEIGNWRQAWIEHGVDEINVRRWVKDLNRSSDATINNPIARTPRGPRSIARTPRGPRFPDIETQVCNFIDRMRSNEDGFTFTRAIICNEALRISREIGITQFTASQGWYQKFMHRMGYTAQQLSRREPLDNQPRSPAENSDPAGFDHGQVEGTSSPDGNQPTSP